MSATSKPGARTSTRCVRWTVFAVVAAVVAQYGAAVGTSAAEAVTKADLLPRDSGYRLTPEISYNDAKDVVRSGTPQSEAGPRART
jgi:hypothetical protein